MERKTGFEPATLALARRCSTPEPLPQNDYYYTWKRLVVQAAADIRTSDADQFWPMLLSGISRVLTLAAPAVPENRAIFRLPCSVPHLVCADPPGASRTRSPTWSQAARLLAHAAL